MYGQEIVISAMIIIKPRFLTLATVAVFLTFPFTSTLNAAFLPEERIDQKSARLEALQLNVVVEDAANKIGLERFGENPAGLVLDEKNSRLNMIYDRRAEDNPFDTYAHETATWPTAYGVLRTTHQAVAVEGASQKLNHEGGTDSQRDVGLRYSGRVGNFLAGAEANYLAEELQYKVILQDYYAPGLFRPIERSARNGYRSNPLHYGGGLGYDARIGGAHFIAGISTRRADEHQPDRYSSDLSYSNEENSGQAIVETKYVDMGFVGRHYSTTSNGLSGHIDDNGTSLRLRGLARYKLLRAGWDANATNSHYTQNFLSYVDQVVDIDDREHNLTVGVAATEAGEWLVGFEQTWSRNCDDIFLVTPEPLTGYAIGNKISDNLRSNGSTIGAERTLGPVTLRGSYAWFNEDVYDASYHPVRVTGHKWGAGAGFRVLKGSTLDVSYSRLLANFPNGSSDVNETRTMVQLNIAFL